MSTGTRPQLGHTLSTILFDDFIPDWANQFYQAKKSEGVSVFTLRFYKQQLGHFLKFCDAQLITKISEITPDLIRQFILWHSDTGHNAGGLHAVYRVLKTFLLWYEDEVEPEKWKNPINKIHAPKLPHKILSPVEIQDVFSMIEVCKGKNILDCRDKAILLFLLDTGVRARELLNINLEDVNLMDGSVMIISGKGGKSRITFLGKRARKSVRKYLTARKDNNPALWITDDMERLDYGGLRKIVVRRAIQSGIKPPTLHSFRRGFAINMLRAGVDIFSLQKLMGHSDLQVLRFYLAQSRNDIAQAHRLGSPVDNNHL